MPSARGVVLMVLSAMLAAASPASAQSQSQSSGKMYCWKNKAGKTECGDKVPYEYQDAAIKEMNRQGVVTSRTEALTPEERKAREAAEEKRRAEEERKEAQRRKDRALMDTFSNEKEIDLKRRRDVQLIETTIELLQGNLKNMIERQNDSRARSEQYKKNNRPVPQPILDDIERTNTERARTERQIALKRKEIAALNQRYDELKKRFAELTAEISDSDKKKAPAPQSAGGDVQKSR